MLGDLGVYYPSSPEIPNFFFANWANAMLNLLFTLNLLFLANSKHYPPPPEIFFSVCFCLHVTVFFSFLGIFLKVKMGHLRDLRASQIFTASHIHVTTQ